jgi:hypothetical protein
MLTYQEARVLARAFASRESVPLQNHARSGLRLKEDEREGDTSQVEEGPRARARRKSQNKSGLPSLLEGGRLTRGAEDFRLRARWSERNAPVRALVWEWRVPSGNVVFKTDGLLHHARKKRVRVFLRKAREEVWEMLRKPCREGLQNRLDSGLLLRRWRSFGSVLGRRLRASWDDAKAHDAVVRG